MGVNCKDLKGYNDKPLKNEILRRMVSGVKDAWDLNTLRREISEAQNKDQRDIIDAVILAGLAQREPFGPEDLTGIQQN